MFEGVNGALPLDQVAFLFEETVVRRQSKGGMGTDSKWWTP